ncbi:hypothetical protein RA281_27800, partial [Pseudomonas syringae pv. tagetis]
LLGGVGFLFGGFFLFLGLLFGLWPLFFFEFFLVFVVCHFSACRWVRLCRAGLSVGCCGGAGGFGLFGCVVDRWGRVRSCCLRGVNAVCG